MVERSFMAAGSRSGNLLLLIYGKMCLRRKIGRFFCQNNLVCELRCCGHRWPDQVFWTKRDHWQSDKANGQMKFTAAAKHEFLEADSINKGKLRTVNETFKLIKRVVLVTHARAFAESEIQNEQWSLPKVINSAAQKAASDDNSSFWEKQINAQRSRVVEFRFF